MFVHCVLAARNTNVKMDMSLLLKKNSVFRANFSFVSKLIASFAYETRICCFKSKIFCPELCLDVVGEVICMTQKVGLHPFHVL